MSLEGLKLVSEEPPKILIDQAMNYFGVSEAEAKEYLISERKKWNEKHQNHMEKMIDTPESQN